MLEGCLTVFEIYSKMVIELDLHRNVDLAGAGITKMCICSDYLIMGSYTCTKLSRKFPPVFVQPRKLLLLSQGRSYKNDFHISHTSNFTRYFHFCHAILNMLYNFVVLSYWEKDGKAAPSFSAICCHHCSKHMFPACFPKSRGDRV